MTKPAVNYRRIDKLRAIAFDRGFTNEDARQFGKLSKTATWEALLELYLVNGESPDTVLEGETVANSRKQSDCLYTLTESPDTSGWINDGSSPVCSFTPQNSINFLDWVDFAQLIAFLLASVGVFVLAMNLWRQINPLNLLPPVKVNIQIGTKL
jgi:hypothetical protein